MTLLWCDQPDVFDPDRPDTLAPVLTSTARAPVPDMALPTPPTPEVPRAEGRYTWRTVPRAKPKPI